MLENEPTHGAQTCPLSATTWPFSLSPKMCPGERGHEMRNPYRHPYPCSRRDLSADASARTTPLAPQTTCHLANHPLAPKTTCWQGDRWGMQIVYMASRPFNELCQPNIALPNFIALFQKSRRSKGRNMLFILTITHNARYAIGAAFVGTGWGR